MSNMTSGLVYFPQNLGKILELKGMSGVEFSKQCYTTHANTAHWLKGRSMPGRGTWTRVEEVLDCPMWLLFHPKGGELYLKLHPKLAEQ